MFLKNKNIIFKIRRSRVTDYAALNSWKLHIFKIIDGRISFYCNNLDRLPPIPKFTFRHLKKGIQEFHRRLRLLTMLWSFEKVLY